MAKMFETRLLKKIHR